MPNVAFFHSFGTNFDLPRFYLMMLKEDLSDKDGIINDYSVCEDVCKGGIAIPLLLQLTEIKEKEKK